MATASKMNKKSGTVKKHSRKYMKRAARRTIAALLMVSALIVAAIPAGVSRAAEDDYYSSGDGYEEYAGGANTLTISSNYNITFHFSYDDPMKMNLEKMTITDSVQPISSNSIILDESFSKDGATYVCTSIGNQMMNKSDGSLKSNISSFTANSVETVLGSAFQGSTGLTNFTGRNVNVIGDYAFQNCSGLSTIAFSSAIDSVGAHAFESTQFKSFPEGTTVDSLGSYAFASCSVDSITLPGASSVSQGTIIGDHVCYDCRNLGTVTFSDNIRSVGNSCFEGCTNLGSVNFNNDGKLTSFGSSVFKDCSSGLSTITFPDSVISMGSNTFENCTSLSKVKFSDNMTGIGTGTFINCIGLTSVNVPASTSKISIGKNVNELDFSACTSLEKIELFNDTSERNQTIDKTALPTDTSNITIHGYRSYLNTSSNPVKTEAYRMCMKNKIKYRCLDQDGWADDYFDVSESGVLQYCDLESYLSEIPGNSELTIPEKVGDVEVNTINAEVFEDITHPEPGVTVNYDLKSVVVKQNVKSVEAGTFYDLPDLEYVEFENENQTKIDNSDNVFPDNAGFYIWGEIKRGTVSDGINAYEYSQTYDVDFRGNDNNGITLYVDGNSDYTLCGVQSGTSRKDTKPGVATLSLPSGIEKIKDDMFISDTGLKNFSADGLVYLEEHQFQASSVEKVTLPATLTNMGALPFKSCGSLSEVTIDESNQNCWSKDGVIYAPANPPVANGEFRVVEALEEATSESITLGDAGKNVTKIDDSAFWENHTLVEFDSGESGVSKIPENCFLNASKIEKVYLRENIEYVYKDAFKITGNFIYTSDTSGKPSFYVYNSDIDYSNGGGREGVFTYNSSQPKKNPYYFYITRDDKDNTKKIVKDEGDNLHLAGYVDDVQQLDISKTCEINFIRGVDGYGQNKKYDNGKDIVLIPTDDTNSNSADFYVKNVSTNYVLKPGVDYSFDGNSYKQSEKGSNYPFFVFGKGQYDEKTSLKGLFNIVDGSGPAGKVIIDHIEYPNGNSRIYNGTKLSFVEGIDYIVIDKNGNRVDPGYYTVTPDLSNIDTTTSFKVTGDDNNASGTVNGRFIITSPSTSNNYIITYSLSDGGWERFQGQSVMPHDIVVRDLHTISKNEAGLQEYKLLTRGLHYEIRNPQAGENVLMGKGAGKVVVVGINEYSNKNDTSVFDIKKSIADGLEGTIPSGSKTMTLKIDNGTYDSKNAVSADLVLYDNSTARYLVEDVDYTVKFSKIKNQNYAIATLQGIGEEYFDEYISSRFPITKQKSTSSSSSSSSGSSSASSSSSSSSKSSSASSSASSSGSSSSASGSSSSGGTSSRTTTSGGSTYNNGGTVRPATDDELTNLLKAAHIDAINGGTADGYQVRITRDEGSEYSFRQALINRYGSLDNIEYYSMDISLLDENGNYVDTTGVTVTMTLPIPDSLARYGANNKMATVDNGGNLEDLNTTYSMLQGRECATFVAPHFSPYGFYALTNNLDYGVMDSTPKTGDPIHPKWFISIGLAALSIFLFLKKDSKPKANPA